MTYKATKGEVAIEGIDGCGASLCLHSGDAEAKGGEAGIAVLR